MLLSLGLSYRITGLAGTMSWRALILVGALVLMVFVLTARTAWSQQLSHEETYHQNAVATETVVDQRTVIVNGEVVEPATGSTPVEETPSEETLTPVPPTEPPQLAVRYDATVLPKPPDLEADSLPATRPETVEPYPAQTPEPTSAPPVEPVPSVELVPEPVDFEQPAPLPAPVAPAVRELTEYDSSPVTGAVEAFQGTADALGIAASESLLMVATRDESLVSMALAVLPTEAEPSSASSPLLEDSEPVSGAMPEPSGGTPQPSSPFALPPPIGGGALPMTGSDVGSGSTHLLLLCVLISILILSRRDGGLSWGFWEPPKPSSALLLPLERPG